EYINIGYFPAKVDDLVNYIPARITGLLMSISSAYRFNFKNGLKIMIRDRKNHKSPNAIYPEAAVAGLLGIELGGTSSYQGVSVEKPTVGDELKKIKKEDMKKTIQIMYSSQILMILIYVFLKLI